MNIKLRAPNFVVNWVETLEQFSHKQTSQHIPFIEVKSCYFFTVLYIFSTGLGSSYAWDPEVGICIFFLFLVSNDGQGLKCTSIVH